MSSRSAMFASAALLLLLAVAVRASNAAWGGLDDVGPRQQQQQQQGSPEASSTPEELWPGQVLTQRRVASWSQRVAHKSACLRRKSGGIYLYHTRKAAGTTLREKLEVAARRWSVSLWETEGASIEATSLALRSVVTVVSVRQPIERILSLYWYEHVGWWDGIRKDHSKMRPLSEWIDEWSDASEWKRSFARQNPGNVYVEVENYLTKMLTAWNRDGAFAPLPHDAVDRAAAALDRFDVVFVCERSGRANHTALLARAVGLEPAVVARLTSKLRATADPKRRLQAKLVPDMAAARAKLERLNAMDLEVYDFALRLDDARVRFLDRRRARKRSAPFSGTAARRRAARRRTRGGQRSDDADGPEDDSLDDDAGAVSLDRPCDPPPSRSLKARSGIFRPPGHKH